MNELASTETYREFKRVRLETGLRLADAGENEQARHVCWSVRQLPEQDEPTLYAILGFLDLIELDDANAAFVADRLAREAILLAHQYDRPDLREKFEATLDEAWAYIQREFVGARYRDTANLRTLFVLSVDRWGDDGQSDGLWVATVQDGTGELDDEPAAALASNDDFERFESGRGRSPLDDICPEGDHEFDTDELRKYAGAATCEECELSHYAIQWRFGQSVPRSVRCVARWNTTSSSSRTDRTAATVGDSGVRR